MDLFLCHWSVMDLSATCPQYTEIHAELGVTDSAAATAEHALRTQHLSGALVT
jgi:hypothetical protein